MRADSSPHPARPWGTYSLWLSVAVVLALHVSLLGLGPPSVAPSPPGPALRAGGVVRLLPAPEAPSLRPTARPNRSPGGRSRAAAPMPPVAEATGLSPERSATARDLRDQLPISTTRWYRWQQGALDALAQLRWQVEAGQYTGCLETVDAASTRPAAWLRSQGSIDAAGLKPDRHTARRAPGSERALTFVREDSISRVFFSARTEAAEVAPTTQDHLSWLPQLLAHIAAGDVHVVLPVAEVSGSVQTWIFQADTHDPWLWHRSAVGPDQTEVTLRLSPAPPHWPENLRLVPPWGPALELHQVTPSNGASFE